MTNGSTVSYSGIVGPGQTLPVAVTGTFFYFPVATLPLFARPSGGVFCQYVAGTGLEDQSPGFSQVEVNNPNNVPLVFQIVAGSQGFIDRRLIQNQDVANVVNAYSNSDWKEVGPFSQLEVPDLTGQEFTDVAGKAWIAVSRISFSAQNQADVVVPVSIGAFFFSGGILLLQLPAAPTLADAGPPFVLNASGAVFLQYARQADIVYVAVFEIYQAVAPGFAGNPPS